MGGGRHHRHAGAVDGDIELSAAGPGRGRNHLAGADRVGLGADDRGSRGAGRFGAPFHPLDRQADAGQLGQQAGRLANGTAAAARAVNLARPGDIDARAQRSSASLGARPCPQAAQWYQARRRVTGPTTVSMVLAR